MIKKCGSGILIFLMYDLFSPIYAELTLLTSWWIPCPYSQDFEKNSFGIPKENALILRTLVKEWTFGPWQVLDFGAEKYTLKCYELYEAKIESFQA